LAGFFEAGSDAAELLELAEAAFDEMALGDDQVLKVRIIRLHRRRPAGIGLVRAPIPAKVFAGRRANNGKS
jgi:hypothetical protein